MTLRSSVLTTALIAGCLLAAPLLARQEPAAADTAKELAALKKSIEAMQKDLQEIKTLLLARPPPAARRPTS